VIVDPVRIRRSRAKGSKLTSPNGLPVVCVTRPGIFGNPFTAGDPFPDGVPEGVDTRPIVVMMFREWLDGTPGYERMLPGRRAELLARLPELRGKNLACFCALDSPCHADLLLALANPPEAD